MTAAIRNRITGQPYSAVPHTERQIADPTEDHAIGAHDKLIIGRALYQYYTLQELSAISMGVDGCSDAPARANAKRAFELYDLISNAGDVCIVPEEQST